MADIDICRNHTLSHEAARKAAENIAQQLDKEFNLSHQWAGDCLQFQRSGVKGTMEVNHSDVRIQARLGLLLKPLRGRFEQEIHRYLDDLFGEG